MYKVICSDLDGTLLNTESCLSAENAKAIDSLLEKGITFVPTTGRTIAELPEEIRNHKSIRYYIYSNGAGIYDKKENKSYEKLVSNEKIKEIMKVLNSYKVLLLCHTDRYVYLDGEAFKNLDDYIVFKSYRELFKLLPEDCFLKDFKGYITAKDNIEMLCAFFAKSENQKECLSRLSEIEGIHITSSADGNVEIINNEANKGNAIRSFSEIVGIPLSEFISAGDSINDIEMLSVAGLSLAVSNAKEETKAAADRVICSNNEHIAKYILENIIDTNS